MWSRHQRMIEDFSSCQASGRTTIIAWRILVILVVIVVVDKATSDTLSTHKEKLIKGEVIVTLSDLEDKGINVTGTVFIACQPQQVWPVLTDYNHLADFIPTMLKSQLISNGGDEKIVEQIGKSGIFLFHKTAYVKLKVKEKYLKCIHFENMSSDFLVYIGEWMLEYNPRAGGTILTYKANIKPDFFAPRFLIRHVQSKDLPKILKAIKRRVESVKQSGEKVIIRHQEIKR